jgi:hypothetical protein
LAGSEQLSLVKAEQILLSMDPDWRRMNRRRGGGWGQGDKVREEERPGDKRAYPVLMH